MQTISSWNWILFVFFFFFHMDECKQPRYFDGNISMHLSSIPLDSCLENSFYRFGFLFREKEGKIFIIQWKAVRVDESMDRRMWFLSTELTMKKKKEFIELPTVLPSSCFYAFSCRRRIIIQGLLKEPYGNSMDHGIMENKWLHFSFAES